MEVLILGGFATFGAKFIAMIFNMDISKAGYLMGKWQTMFGPIMKMTFSLMLFIYHFVYIRFDHSVWVGRRYALWGLYCQEV